MNELAKEGYPTKQRKSIKEGIYLKQFEINFKKLKMRLKKLKTEVIKNFG